MFLQAYRNIGRILRSRRGGVAPLLAIALPLLMGCAGLAVDTIEWSLMKRQLQRATDSAAIAGVYSLVQGSDASAGVDEDLSKASWLDPKRAVEVDYPVAGREADPYAISVRVTAPMRLTFAGFFVSHAPMISATATATVVQTGQYCGFAIGSDSDTGLLIRANSVVDGDCGIATNASSPNALKIDAGASVSLHPLESHGGIDGEGSAAAGWRSYGLSQNDPMEDTEPPLVPTSGCPNMTLNADSHRTLTIDPGCYGNLVLNGSTRLQDGEYILNRGSLIIGPNADVSCDACTIYLTSDDPDGEPGSIGSVKIDQNATVHLSAPSDGPDAGIVIYQDRHASSGGNENVIGGNSFSKISGLVYTPAGALHVDGRSGPDVRCARFIGQTLILEGRIYIAGGCSGGQRINLRGADVRLIG